MATRHFWPTIQRLAALFRTSLGLLRLSVLHRVHYVRPQRQLQAGFDVVSRVHEVSVLEEQNTPAFWNYIDALFHVPRVKRGRAAFQQLLSVLSLGVV